MEAYLPAFTRGSVYLAYQRLKGIFDDQWTVPTLASTV